jgi:excinuclease ABC subunit A
LSRHKYIEIKHAKVHNLKDVSVTIPHNKITVITGVSGSGKSSLAFDTIYAEGQRRFVESLSAYARQFLERMNKPDVESITGLPPAIAIEQKQPQKNPRSTVGTTTEIYDYLRLLYGRIGITICRSTGKIVKKDSAETVLEELMKWKDDDKLYILFPLDLNSKNQAELFKYIKESGFFRAVTDDSDEIIDLDSLESLTALAGKNIYILVDRLVLKHDEETKSRMIDSLELAFRSGSGRIAVKNLTRSQFRKFSNLFEDPESEIIYVEPEPRLFSFNNPYGACPTCQGFGRNIGIDEDLVVPDKSKSIRRGAIHAFKGLTYSSFQRDLIKIAPKYKIPIDEPYSMLNEEQLRIIWDGVNGYLGINGFFSMLEQENYKVQNRVMISRYRGYTTCKACGGSRLRTSARQVFVNGKNIPELIKMPLDKFLQFIESFQLSSYDEKVAGQVVAEIIWRTRLLVEIGLEYLTLDRLTHTLSGGEAQRINLSTALGSSLVGTLYVLDEPSIGMHHRDTQRLINILYKLRNLGNTIIVVEHDPDIIKKADNIIDMGPKAGEHGGEVCYSGNFENLLNDPESLTGQYISGIKRFTIPQRRKVNHGNEIVILNPREHNLKIDEVAFPLNVMTVVTGVSGSGKSTLVHDILYTALKKIKVGYDGKTGSYSEIRGYAIIDDIQLVDQSPIGKSSRSTPATYTKAFDAIRDIYSTTQISKQMGYKPGYFSFNVPGGRCEVCEGEGIVRVDMQFLSDVHLECESCKGSRYKKEIRNVTFNGKSIIDILDMTVDDAFNFFEPVSKVTRKLKVLQDVGLGYLRLGQPSTMLSGGESQRIKLANHLDSNANHTLFIFDEPTTGLHLDDISKLLDCFDRLVKAGHSIVIIEHNMNVIASADWIIDLGPEAGAEGGQLVATGTPEHIAKFENSYTGKALREFFADIR